MAAIRVRYYTWLFKAYFKKWKKTIFTSLLSGILIFFIFIYLLNFYLIPFLQRKIQKIGYSGVYTSSTIPDEILSDLSYGLTSVASDGSIHPAAATKWDIKNSGKEYIFYIKSGQKFHDGEELTAQNLPYNFRDVKKTSINKYEVEFQLKTVYAPFLSVVSRPILLNNFVGLGNYSVENIYFDAGFVKSLTLENIKDPAQKKNIIFYPTQDSLKTAYMLGEVDTIFGINSTQLSDKDLATWKNSKVIKTTDYQDLVTLFYNNNDSILSDKKVRQALNYALPAEFDEGERSFSSIPPTSLYFSKGPNYGVTGTDIAKTLLSQSSYDDKVLTISTTDEYKDLALQIQKIWQSIGVKTQINIVDGIPNNFQIFLYRFQIPQDPDQYTLWYSGGENNIANYKSLRIDTLLEQGRLTVNQQERIKIYADFQKYIADDVPASFIYFPYEYTVERR